MKPKILFSLPDGRDVAISDELDWLPRLGEDVEIEGMVFEVVGVRHDVLANCVRLRIDATGSKVTVPPPPPKP